MREAEKDGNSVITGLPIATSANIYHEYKTIACLILSGLANNKILDFGGKALLQPGLALISQKVFGDRLINLSNNNGKFSKLILYLKQIFFFSKSLKYLLISSNNKNISSKFLPLNKFLQR